MKKILLTGGNGFIGGNVREQLGEKYEILSPSHAELDLLDYSAVSTYLEKTRPDAVIHAAFLGTTRKDCPKDIVKANLQMFFNIARCKKHFGRMINLGSGAEYDHAKEIVQASEEDFDRVVPSDDYGFCKYVCAKYIENTEGITNLRVFGCFGKHEDKNTRFISNSICRSIRGEPIAIENRNVRFSYLYVSDLVHIIDYFICNNGKFKSYNVVPDESYDLLAIAQKIKKITGNHFEIVVKNKGLGPEYTGNNGRLRAEMPKFKFTPMDAAITELYKSYKNNTKGIGH